MEVVIVTYIDTLALHKKVKALQTFVKLKKGKYVKSADIGSIPMRISHTTYIGIT
jgi:hypothetical protein